MASTTSSNIAAQGTAADWTIPQGWDRYSAVEHATWDKLYARQVAVLQGRAAPQFLHGLDALRLSESRHSRSRRTVRSG